MNDQTPQEPSIFQLLFNRKMFKQLFLLWLLFVVVGSFVSAFARQNHIVLRDGDPGVTKAAQSALLANNTNVDFSYPDVTREVTATSVGQTRKIYPSRLVIPKIGTDLPISNPQTRDIEKLDAELRSASVRYPDSATLGVQGGNMLLFGHSSRLPIVHNKLYKAFNNIEKLKKGDMVKVLSGTDTYSYQVSKVYQSSSLDGRIPLVVPGHRVTLLTCDSFGKKSDRWVVEANFIGKNI